MEKLSSADFLSVVKNTPLVSIDFHICNGNDQYLLGKRLNPPAQGYWFNLGGRIYKNERKEAAMQRIFRDETGHPLPKGPHEFFGVFDHIYDDNVFNDTGFGTHYVNLAYRILVPFDFNPTPRDQHDVYEWWDFAQLMKSEHVHANTKIAFPKG